MFNNLSVAPHITCLNAYYPVTPSLHPRIIEFCMILDGCILNCDFEKPFWRKKQVVRKLRKKDEDIIRRKRKILISSFLPDIVFYKCILTTAHTKNMLSSFKFFNIYKFSHIISLYFKKSQVNYTF